MAHEQPCGPTVNKVSGMIDYDKSLPGTLLLRFSLGFALRPVSPIQECHRELTKSCRKQQAGGVPLVCRVEGFTREQVPVTPACQGRRQQQPGLAPDLRTQR